MRGMCRCAWRNNAGAETCQGLLRNEYQSSDDWVRTTRPRPGYNGLPRPWGCATIESNSKHDWISLHQHRLVRGGNCMDYGKALTFITEDPRWQQKIAIGTGVFIISFLLSFILIGVLGFLIITGYTVRLLQNVRDGLTYPLPEWDQWGDDLARGFKLFVVSLVWSLPILIFSVPTGIGSAIADNARSDFEFFGSMLAICGGCLSVLYGLFLAVVMPGYSIAFARDEQINSGLRFRDIWDWTQAHLGDVVMVAIIYLIASIAFALLGFIVGALLCLVGLVVTLPLASLVTYLYQY